FAKRTQLALSELQVFQLKSQDLAGTQTIEEHQAHESQIAIGAETLPELRDFFRREWHDDPPILFEAKAPGDGGAGSAVAERGPLGIAALEMHFAGRNFLSGVEAIAAAHCTEAMIHGLRCGFGILVELMTNIVDDRGLGYLGESSVLGFEPAREIEKVVGIVAGVSDYRGRHSPNRVLLPGCHALDRGRCWRARQADRPRRVSCTSPAPALQQLLDALQIRSCVAQCGSANGRERVTRTQSVVGP